MAPSTNRYGESLLLVTETCEGFEPLVPGKHFVMAKTDDLTACCEYYLNHEDEREAIAEAAHNFMRDSSRRKKIAAHSCSK